MSRQIEPELLDSLPVEHPDARHSRRDLRVLNGFMGNHRWLARTLSTLLRPGETALELGAGMGELGLRLAARQLPVDGLDLCPRPDGWPAPRRWLQADLRRFDGYDDYAAVVGNLIFHQFTDAELAEFGARIRRRARVILACEPARQGSSQFFLRTLGPLFGASHVTLHDGRVSIAAGFLGAELPQALGLADSEWNCRCTTTATGAYRLVAIRRP